MRLVSPYNFQKKKLRLSRNKYNYRIYLSKLRLKNKNGVRNYGACLNSSVKDLLYPCTSKKTAIFMLMSLRYLVFKLGWSSSLRESDALINSCSVRVNGNVISNPFFKCKVGSMLYFSRSYVDNIRLDCWHTLPYYLLQNRLYNLAIVTDNGVEDYLVKKFNTII